MFNQIKETNKPFPFQTFSIAFCSVAITIGTIIFPNFSTVFGSSQPDLKFIQYFSLAFQHGYDTNSAIIHMGGCVVILLFIGGSLEKILGPNRFFLFNIAILCVYAVAHQIIGLIGHGLTPVLFAYVPFIAYAANEGRLIKTRSMYDEYYKTLWFLILVVLLVIPILLSIIPIYFDSNAHLTYQIILGNSLHLILLLTGLAFTYQWKDAARHRLIYFSKKKKFPSYRFEKYSPFLALFYPLLLLFILIMNK